MGKKNIIIHARSDGQGRSLWIDDPDGFDFSSLEDFDAQADFLEGQHDLEWIDGPAWTRQLFKDLRLDEGDIERASVKQYFDLVATGTRSPTAKHRAAGSTPPPKSGYKWWEQDTVWDDDTGWRRPRDEDFKRNGPVKHFKIISAKRHADIRGRYEVYESALDRKFPSFRKRGGSLTAEQLAQLPPRPDNEELGKVEQYEFYHTPPDRLMVYITVPTDAEQRAKGYYARGSATTWTGDFLGEVKFGRPFRGSLGDERQPVDVTGINGVSYYGTYFKSAGNYAQIRRRKG